MTKHEKLAEEYFLSGYNCAQAVFLAFAEEQGFSREAAARIASSFGGGVGGMREMCGALSGLCMAAGLLYGYDSPKAYEGRSSAGTFSASASIRSPPCRRDGRRNITKTAPARRWWRRRREFSMSTSRRTRRERSRPQSKFA